MLICRCAWHRRYFGHSSWNGIASWRGLTVRFTDGICARCAARFREENQSFLDRKREPSLATSNLRRRSHAA